MLYHKFMSTSWVRFFTGRSDPSASPASSLSNSVGEGRGEAHARQRRHRPAPIPGSDAFWLALVSSYLPEPAWSTLEEGLRLAVRTRAYWGQTGKAWPDERPDAAPERRRFGMHGEELRPKDLLELRRLLIRELQQAVHTLEAPDLSRLERQRRLLLHGARLGQVYAELARRCWQRVPLEELQRALDALLA